MESFLTAIFIGITSVLYFPIITVIFREFSTDPIIHFFLKVFGTYLLGKIVLMLLKKEYRGHLWDLFGFRAIWEKIIPPANNQPGWRPPSTFVIWVVGIYTAIFGIAKTQYELKSRGQNYDLVYEQVDMVRRKAITYNPEILKLALEEIPELQTKKPPLKPGDWSDFTTTLRAFLGGEDKVITKYLKEIVLNNRSRLKFETEVKLGGIDLSEVTFEGVAFKNINFDGANFQKTKIMRTSVLENVVFNDADFREATIGSATRFVKADFINADLTKVSFGVVNFTNCDFTESKLINATFEEIVFTNCSLKGAIFDSSKGSLIIKESNFEGASFQGALIYNSFVDSLGEDGNSSELMSNFAHTNFSGSDTSVGRSSFRKTNFKEAQFKQTRILRSTF